MTKKFQAQCRPLWHAIPAMLIALSSTAYAAPLAKGDVSRSECIDAMKLANAMYASAAPRLFAPLEIPKEMQSRLILGASELDISGGEALENGPEFDKLQAMLDIPPTSWATGRYIRPRRGAPFARLPSMPMVRLQPNCCRRR